VLRWIHRVTILALIVNAILWANYYLTIHIGSVLFSIDTGVAVATPTADPFFVVGIISEAVDTSSGFVSVVISNSCCTDPFIPAIFKESTTVVKATFVCRFNCFVNGNVGL
jgi:hypothetical protein